MYYRRKIILALVQLFDGQVEKLRLQKLLFLFTIKQEKREYDFIPYKYGCYSFSANADLTTMVSKGILSELNNQVSISTPEHEGVAKVDFRKMLKPADLLLLQQLKREYGSLSPRALMMHTYINYPFYATRSGATDMLSDIQLQKVEASRPVRTDTVLFTIGYEGISLERYLLSLLKRDVKVLVDVRNNPLSMKFGFSKSQLKRYCESVDISYVHLPEVGIQSDQRRDLHSQADYDDLFAMYRAENLSRTTSAQLHILDLLKEHQRIALTCFEANICQCHRKHLAEAIQLLPGFNYKIEHI